MVYFSVCKTQALFDFSIAVSFKISFSTIPRSLSWEMYLFLEVLFLMFHLVFMILIMPSANSLQEAKPRDQYLSLNVLHNLRKKNASHLNTNILPREQLPFNVMAGSVHPKFLVLTMWPQNPLGHGTGASVSLLAAKGQHSGPAVARVQKHRSVEGCSFQLPQLCHSLHKSFSNKYS